MRFLSLIVIIILLLIVLPTESDGLKGEREEGTSIYTEMPSFDTELHSEKYVPSKNITKKNRYNSM